MRAGGGRGVESGVGPEPSPVTMVMDRLTDKVRHNPPPGRLSG